MPSGARRLRKYPRGVEVRNCHVIRRYEGPITISPQIDQKKNRDDKEGPVSCISTEKKKLHRTLCATSLLPLLKNIQGLLNGALSVCY